ncbi:MAG: hypothetical protein C5B59_19610 [Bacteroidetes bacterium]|nr:MAG: hypothetical protein C5B59_19610 [Bacteroidota bacterium]
MKESDMAKNSRRQLSLFLKKNEASEFESIRKTFNPDQFQLIACHVTVCREDEIENISIGACLHFYILTLFL